MLTCLPLLSVQNTYLYCLSKMLTSIVCPKSRKWIRWIILLDAYSSQINPLLQGVTNKSVEKNGHEGCFYLKNACFSYISPIKLVKCPFLEELDTVTHDFLSVFIVRIDQRWFISGFRRFCRKLLKSRREGCFHILFLLLVNKNYTKKLKCRITVA